MAVITRPLSHISILSPFGSSIVRSILFVASRNSVSAARSVLSTTQIFFVTYELDLLSTYALPR